MRKIKHATLVIEWDDDDKDEYRWVGTTIPIGARLENKPGWPKSEYGPTTITFSRHSTGSTHIPGQKDANERTATD